MVEKIQIQIVSSKDGINTGNLDAVKEAEWVTIGSIDYDKDKKMSYLRKKAKEMIKKTKHEIHLCRVIFPSGTKLILTEL
ncbi:hypothetical protein ACFLQN_02640 [Candidatus Aenigmatarchaeota archaeon]